MQKKLILLSIILFQVTASPLYARNWTSFFKKTVQENITKEYPVQGSCTVIVANVEGSVTVKGWTENRIAIEAVKKGTEDELKATTLSSKAEGKDVTITTKVALDQSAADVEYVLMVPEQCSVIITQTKGIVRVKGISGSLNISVEEGAIDINDSMKTVSAKTGYGDIKLKQKKFDDASSIFLESHNGSITLSLPRLSKASLNAKTTKRVIVSDLPVTLAPVTLKLNKDSWERIKKEVSGTLGGIKGGAPITLEATNGIVIKEY